MLLNRLSKKSGWREEEKLCYFYHWRHAKKDSLNLAWRNASLRGFADYVQTEGFGKNIERLIKLAKQKKIVLMCAESVPWRCHRSLIADALKVHGIQVKHIMSQKTCNDHHLTLWAKVKDFQVTYPQDVIIEVTAQRQVVCKY